MRQLLEFIEAAIWASFLDDNEWWIKAAPRSDLDGIVVNPRRH